MNAKYLWPLCALSLLLAAGGPAGCESNPGGTYQDALTDDTDGGESTFLDRPCEAAGYVDTDGDKIPDMLEGSADSDGDTIPDAFDTDSDNDGLPDSEEVGEGLCVFVTPDSDYDGQPDFRDPDSDNNGRPDGVDGTEDVDGDGIPNAYDRDDDGDSIDDSVEIGPDSADPVDTDQDGIPDMWDVDSDDDTILDADERRGDADLDGLPNFRDTDSDNDTLPDEDEAGDDDPLTPPDDSDEDGTPDFVDVDSDNDGLDDGLELSVGCSPTDVDTDGDSFTDLAEYTVGTDCADAASKIEGFYLILPYKPYDPPELRQFEFDTKIRQADVFFLIDSTGSMSEEIETVKTKLQGTIVPGIVAEIPDARIGIGEFRDQDDTGYFPVRVRQNVTDDILAVQAAINAFEWGGGSGYTSILEALYQMVTGEGFGAHLPPAPGCLDAGWGYPCFRTGALPIFIAFSDAEARNGPSGLLYTTDIFPPPHSYAAAVNALTDAGARFIGVDSGEADVDFRALSIDTGTVSVSGSPLLFEVASNGADIDLTIVEAVVTLANQVAFDVDTVVEERPFIDDDVDATRFVKSVTPMDAFPADNIMGFDSRQFYGVLPGTTLTFEVAFKNDFLEEERMPRAFRCRIVVRANFTTKLDEKVVLIIVPGTQGILE